MRWGRRTGRDSNASPADILAPSRPSVASWRDGRGRSWVRTYSCRGRSGGRVRSTRTLRLSGRSVRCLLCRYIGRYSLTRRPTGECSSRNIRRGQGNSTALNRRRRAEGSVCWHIAILFLTLAPRCVCMYECLRGYLFRPHIIVVFAADGSGAKDGDEDEDWKGKGRTLRNRAREWCNGTK